MALGDYIKTTYINGAAPGISAERLNRNENKTAELDTAVSAHISDSVYQTAVGTATAVTLTIAGALVNGFSVTFIASASNNGAATTINTKPLYKPNTTSAPALTAGKAYTVWYNSTSDCFFIKASAEGDAVAANVLAGKTFSSDNDTGLVGTMTNNGALSKSLAINGSYAILEGYHNGSGKVTQSITTKAAAAYSPSTEAQTISAAQYLSGAQTISPVTGTATAADVVSGKTFASSAGIGLLGTNINKKWQKGSFSDNNTVNTITLAFTPSTVLAETYSSSYDNGYTAFWSSQLDPNAAAHSSTHMNNTCINMIGGNWDSTSDGSACSNCDVIKKASQIAVSTNKLQIKGFNGGGTVYWIAYE